jgi:hypothetical protein
VTSKSVGTGPSAYEKRIYRAAVSQRLRNTELGGNQLSPNSSQRFATAHTAEISMQVLGVFPGRPISPFRDVTWTSRSSDHAVPNYLLWGYAKRMIYETRPVNIADLKHRILECIQRISKAMLQRVMEAFQLRLQECTEQHGGHILSVIFKQ